MDNTDGDSTDSADRRNKVARLIDEYGLEGVGAELEERWTTTSDDRMSLRALADYFNQRLLSQALSETGPIVGRGGKPLLAPHRRRERRRRDQGPSQTQARGD